MAAGKTATVQPACCNYSVGSEGRGGGGVIAVNCRRKV